MNVEIGALHFKGGQGQIWTAGNIKMHRKGPSRVGVGQAGEVYSIAGELHIKRVIGEGEMTLCGSAAEGDGKWFDANLIWRPMPT